MPSASRSSRNTILPHEHSQVQDALGKLPPKDFVLLLCQNHCTSEKSPTPAGNVSMMSPRGKESIRKSNASAKGGSQVEEGGGTLQGLSFWALPPCLLAGSGGSEAPLSLFQPSSSCPPFLFFFAKLQPRKYSWSPHYVSNPGLTCNNDHRYQ